MNGLMNDMGGMKSMNDTDGGMDGAARTNIDGSSIEDAGNVGGAERAASDGSVVRNGGADGAMTWSPDDIRHACRLYAVTDSAWLSGRTLAECVREALEGGATFVQLREKGATTDELVRTAATLIPICREYGVPFVIDDDVEAARLSGADGVHVGQSDVVCAQAREMLGEDAIIGVSAATPEEARAAQAAGADYLGVGTVFGTPTKKDCSLITFDDLRAVRAATDLPITVIGGVNAETIPRLAGYDVDGVAVVSAIFAAADITAATRHLLRELDENGIG